MIRTVNVGPRKYNLYIVAVLLKPCMSKLAVEK